MNEIDEFIKHVDGILKTDECIDEINVCKWIADDVKLTRIKENYKRSIENLALKDSDKEYAELYQKVIDIKKENISNIEIRNYCDETLSDLLEFIK